jgi:class 3 adenylate cyclase
VSPVDRGSLAGLLSDAAALSAPARHAFHGELAASAIERMRRFSALLLIVHVPLLVRDLTLDRTSASSVELRWQGWLFVMHAVIALSAAAALLALRERHSARTRAGAAYLITAVLLVWSAWLAGVDQLIGAGITIYVIVNLASALFVTFDRKWTTLAFAAGLATFIAGQLFFSPNSALAFSQIVNGTGFAFACWLFARMLYGTKASAFANRVTIAHQHAELEQGNRKLSATIDEVTRLNSELAEKNTLLEGERAHSERLLRAVLPSRIVERLRRGESPIADAHTDVTVLLADLASFTRLTSELSAPEMVTMLDQLFSEFDRIAAHYELEKIKTAGDGYLVVRGIARPSEADVVAAADAALAMQSAVERVSDSRGRPLSLRVGLTRGDIVAGVLGRERLLYDIWGDAVNLASRLETSAEPGETLVSETVTALLAHSHVLGPNSERELKGKGRVAVRSLLGRRVAASS